MLTQAKLQEILNYNPETGEFKWFSGKKCGTPSKGYYVVKVDKRQYLLHRLAWLYVYGRWPKNQIDHINGIRNDNRITNLREVSLQNNGRNRKEHRGGHLLGTSFNKESKKWVAQIQIFKQKCFLGYYNTQQEAHEAYLKKLKELNNEQN